MRAVVAIMVLAVACGPSSAELRTAKSAIYAGDPHRIMELAAKGAADQNYALGAVDEGHLTFETLPRFYSPEGDIQSPGAQNYTKVDNHSVQVTFVVTVAEIASNQFMITVTSRTWQYLAGSPQMRELAPEDPNLPPFVRGRADALALAVYDRTRGYVMAPPSAEAPRAH